MKKGGAVLSLSLTISEVGNAGLSVEIGVEGGAVPSFTDGISATGPATKVDGPPTEVAGIGRATIRAPASNSIVPAEDNNDSGRD